MILALRLLTRDILPDTGRRVLQTARYPDALRDFPRPFPPRWPAEPSSDPDLRNAVAEPKTAAMPTTLITFFINPSQFPSKPRAK